ncbi:helix-turn-helix transcriptional regulator [Kiloniella laminariae]|uniref:Helix-turn-helix transcriptional regulator n=1 Tax=Kiloniella laminariae TaxID=454162 RepID=A0ABT4LJX5_9PROT|nr:helix-turn-helix transcriptional regulator [Kiloniella laminariae]MCZ4281410.1 helix-turn-helix transcriptional regulator [Kiloniella laminariae]
MSSTSPGPANPVFNRRVMLWILLFVQISGTLFFLSDALGDQFFASQHFPGLDHDVTEFFVVVAMSISVAFTATEIKRVLYRQRRMEEQLRIASGAFAQMLDQYFIEWTLTPAEREVALFLIKGLSFSDIAQLRQTREGTIKAQCNAIYRKASVSGRPQLLSFFIEELLADELMPSTPVPQS